MIIDTNLLRKRLDDHYQHMVNEADLITDNKVALSRFNLLEKLHLADEHLIECIETLATKLEVV
jgi:hypothetical protein